MSDKYKAQINKDGSGAFLDVFAEANSQYEAQQLLEAQYPGYRVIGIHKVIVENDSTSNGGCAGVVALFALLPAGYALIRLAT